MSKLTNDKKKMNRGEEQGPSFAVDYRASFAEKAEDADVEIDDFLMDGDGGGLAGEELLTKWGETVPDDMEEEVTEPKKRRGKRRYGVFVGAVVMLLALTGVGFIAGLIGTNIYNAATDDSEMRAYDVSLSTLVMQDPAPFESTQKADPEFVQSAALWKTITGSNGTNYTQYDDSGRVVFPLGEVASACRQLFGPDCQLSPKSPAEESFFTYDEAANQYHVSLFSADSSFSPYVESIRNTADGRILKVGYVSPTDPWRTQTDSSGAVDKPTPIKYMEYVMRTDPSTQEEYLYAVRSLEPASSKG